jgi:hypothetical protein
VSFPFWDVTTAKKSLGISFQLSFIVVFQAPFNDSNYEGARLYVLRCWTSYDGITT